MGKTIGNDRLPVAPAANEWGRCHQNGVTRPPTSWHWNGSNKDVTQDGCQGETIAQ